jgi:hypothetical protein
MQYYANHTLLLEVNVASDRVVSQTIKPMIKDVLKMMQSLVDPTLILESNESTKVVEPVQYLLIPLFPWRVMSLPKWLPRCNI